jgi:hypothetical protein
MDKYPGLTMPETYQARFIYGGGCVDRALDGEGRWCANSIRLYQEGLVRK